MSLVIGLDLAYDSISPLELSLESSIEFTQRTYNHAII